MKARRVVMLSSAIAAIVILLSPPRVRAVTPPFVFPDGCCYYNGTIVRTVVPPASNPREGQDNFYGFSNADPNQKGVVAVAPGAIGYHGGHWKFFLVTFNPGVTPYVLTSEAAVIAAQTAGDVTIVRIPEMDFKCPIQF